MCVCVCFLYKFENGLNFEIALQSSIIIML